MFIIYFAGNYKLYHNTYAPVYVKLIEVKVNKINYIKLYNSELVFTNSQSM